MRAPEKWIAVLRMVVGAWFFKSIFTKIGIGLLGGFFHVPSHRRDGRQ